MPTCRVKDGGSPACRLGQLPSHLAPRTVEVRGNSYLNIVKAREYGARDTELDPLPYPLKGHFDVMIIGESPAHADDFRGLPFQNDAGAKLSEFVDKSGLDTSRIYVTNIVKCKAPKRKPAVPEINACKEAHLYREIAEIAPKVIILMGNIPCRLFNLHNKGGLNAMHGKVFELPIPKLEDSPTYTVIPTFNPSAFMFRPNPQLEQRVVQDYRNAAMVLSGRSVDAPQEADFQVCDTLDKVRSLVDTLKQQSFFAFDTESTALPWTKNPMICMSFCWGYPKQTAVLPFYQHDPDAKGDWLLKPVFTYAERKQVIDLLGTVFEDPKISKAAHNIKYDANVLRNHLGLRILGFWFDTMKMHHDLHEEPSHALEALGDEEFSYGDYSEGVRNIVGHGKELRRTYDHIPDEILWPYAATDAEVCWRLCVLYYNRLQATPHLWKLYCEEGEPLLKALAEPEWFGAPINLDVVDRLYKEYEVRQEELLMEMRAQTHPSFKPLSSPQVTDAFIKMGYGELIKDDKAAGGFSANKKILNDIKDDVPLASQLLEYRTNRKMMSTYLDNARKDLDKDGRLRYSWFPLTVTGRLSCRFFHQIPGIDEQRVAQGKPIMRDILVAPPGYTYVYADYSQVELRILAILAKDQEMLRIMADPNEDLHATSTYEFLKQVWPGYTEEIAREDKFNRREVGKRINFGLAYGSQGHALVKTGKWKDKNGIERSFTWDMLNEGMKNWRARFVGVGDYIENTPEIARSNGGIVRSAYDRERRLRSRLNSADDFQRGEAERECVNFRIQSTAGSITNRTIILVHQALEKYRADGVLAEDDVYLVNTVHDSVAYLCRDHLVNWFCKVLIQIGERPIPQLDHNSFKLDVGIGRSWTEAEMNKIDREKLYAEN